MAITPTPSPVTAEEFKRLLALHSGLPQCRICMQPQRCATGRLLDTIGVLTEQLKGRRR